MRVENETAKVALRRVLVSRGAGECSGNTVDAVCGERFRGEVIQRFPFVR